MWKHSSGSHKFKQSLFCQLQLQFHHWKLNWKHLLFFPFFGGGGGCFRQSATLKFVHRFFFLLKVVSNPKSTCTCSNVLSMIYLGYRTLVLHLHKKSPSKVFYISDTAQTNLRVKVTKTCHNGKLTPSIISNGIVVIPSTESQKCMKDWIKIWYNVYYILF